MSDHSQVVYWLQRLAKQIGDKCDAGSCRAWRSRCQTGGDSATSRSLCHSRPTGLPSTSLSQAPRKTDGAIIAVRHVATLEMRPIRTNGKDNVGFAVRPPGPSSEVSTGARPGAQDVESL
jgi:hypothetical protein